MNAIERIEFNVDLKQINNKLASLPRDKLLNILQQIKNKKIKFQIGICGDPDKVELQDLVSSEVSCFATDGPIKENGNLKEDWKKSSQCLDEKSNLYETNQVESNLQEQPKQINYEQKTEIAYSPTREVPEVGCSQNIIGRSFQSEEFHALKLSETNPLEHDRSGVNCMQILQKLPDIESCAGWLISSSKGLLNLWSCEQDCSLDLKHSQEAELQIIDICADLEAGFVFGASQIADARDKDCLSVISLKLEDLLAVRSTQQFSWKDIRKVCSLHQIGNKLTRSVAVAAGPVISVYKYEENGKTLKFKADWQAYDGGASVSHLCLSDQISAGLITASSRGAISVWDLVDKPDRPILTLNQSSVSGLEELHNGNLITTDFESNIRIWDLRMTANPLIKLSIVAEKDGGIRRMSVNQLGDIVAVATANQVFCVGISEQKYNCNSCVYHGGDVPLSLAWNTFLDDLYIGKSSGSIIALRVS